MNFLFKFFDLEQNNLITHNEMKALLRKLEIDFRDHDRFIRVRIQQPILYHITKFQACFNMQDAMKDRFEAGIDYKRFKESITEGHEDDSIDILTTMSGVIL